MTDAVHIVPTNEKDAVLSLVVRRPCRYPGLPVF